MAKIEESVKNYLNNRISETISYDPERGALWGHSTTLDCAVDIFADGNLKSTKKLLLDGADLRGKVLTAPKRLTTAYQSAYWIENGINNDYFENPQSQELAKKFVGTPLNELTERQRKAILEPCSEYETPGVDDYIAGAIGRVLSQYSGDQKVGFIFPLNKLKKEKKFVDVVRKEVENDCISGEQYSFKFKLTNINTNEHSDAYELNIIEKDNSSGVLSADKGLFLIGERHYPEFKDKLAKKIKQIGKPENYIKNALDRVYSFNNLFENPDQAAGWLSNTPEGKEILKQKEIDLTIPDFSKNKEFQGYLEGKIYQIAHEIDDRIRVTDKMERNLCEHPALFLRRIKENKNILNYQITFLKKIEDAYVGLGYSRKNSRKKIIEDVEDAFYYNEVASPFIKREMGIKTRRSQNDPVVLTAAEVFGLR